jgi:hypothetical protein
VRGAQKKGPESIHELSRFFGIDPEALYYCSFAWLVCCRALFGHKHLAIDDLTNAMKPLTTNEAR